MPSAVTSPLLNDTPVVLDPLRIYISILISLSISYSYSNAALSNPLDLGVHHCKFSIFITPGEEYIVAGCAGVICVVIETLLRPQVSFYGNWWPSCAMSILKCQVLR